MKKSLLVGAASALTLLATISAYDPSSVYACHNGTPHGQETTCTPTGGGGTGGTVNNIQKTITNTQDSSSGDVTSTGGSATSGECRNRCSATGGGSDVNVETGDITGPTIN